MAGQIQNLEDDMTGLSQEMGNRDLMGWGQHHQVAT